MKRSLFLLAVALTIHSGNTRAFDFIRSQGNGMGQTILLSRTLPSTLVTVPSGGMTAGEWRLETGFDRRFDMSDLDQFYLAGAYRYNKLTAAIGVSKFGNSDLYSELTTKIAAAWQFDSLTVGVNFSNLLVQFGGNYDDLSASTLGGGVSYRAKRWYAAAAVDNLTSPKLDNSAPEINPRYYIYTEFTGKQSFAVTGRATLEKDQDPQFGLGQTIFIADNSAVFWGISTGPLEYGAGVEFGIKGGTISYAFSDHPVLGFSHTISVSIGGGFKKHGDEGEFE